MSKVSNNQSWVNIFNKFNILNTIKSDGYIDITANEIKSVDGKEARLMTKVDFRENLPNIMRDEGLSILAINNGTYRIAKNDPFIDISNKLHNRIIDLEAPKDIISIDPFNIKSESAALDIAYISNMTRDVFKEDTFLAIRGRLRGSLNFNIDKTNYNVDGVQIEVDGGYEGRNSIHLIEAKIGYNNNINIRQLLYPQLYWEKETKGKKYIQSHIFYLQDNLFRFIPYVYDGIKGYADHTNEKIFRFKDNEKDIYSLYEIPINQNNVDTTIPFPQADRFDKINDMLIIISNTDNNFCMDKEELQLHFDIVGRQIDYYYNVLKWLKLCTEIDNCIVLTEKANYILQLPFKKRIEEIANIVFSEPITNNLLNNRLITLDMFRIYRVNSESTMKRRLQTITAWIKYFKNILEDE